MKNIYSILLALLVLTPVWGGDMISTEDFKKITTMEERLRVLWQAPPEQKEELKKICIHLNLLEYCGGEDGLKTEKERCVSKERGFKYLEEIFSTHGQIWGRYMGGVYVANQNAKMKREQLVREWKALETEHDIVIVKRLPIVHRLVFNMAASPKALALEKRVETLYQDWWYKFIDQRVVNHGVGPVLPITKKEWMEADRQINEVFEEMKKLPTLTPEQAQKEYDEFPEERIRTSLL